MEILSVQVQIMNVSKVFSKTSKMLMLETVVLFYINAVFTSLTFLPTHTLSLLSLDAVQA